MTTPISKEMAAKILAAWPHLLAVVASGGKINEAIAAQGLARETVRMWRVSDPVRKAEWDAAHQESADAYAEMIRELIENGSIDPADKRVRMDALRWLAAKRNPRMYSDKAQLTLDVNHRVDLTKIILAADARIAARSVPSISVMASNSVASGATRACDTLDAELVPRLEDLL